MTAAATSIGRDVLYRLIHAGELPVLRIGRRIVISRASLEALLAKEEIA